MGKPGFNSMAVLMVCVVNKVASGQVFSEFVGFYFVKYHSTTFHIHFISYSIQLLASLHAQQRYMETLSPQFVFPHIFYLNQHIYQDRGWTTKDTCFDSSRRQNNFLLFIASNWLCEPPSLLLNGYCCLFSLQ